MRDRIRQLLLAAASAAVASLSPACGPSAADIAKAEAEAARDIALCGERHTAGCDLRIMTECSAGDTACPAFVECQRKAIEVRDGLVCR